MLALLLGMLGGGGGSFVGADAGDVGFVVDMVGFLGEEVAVRGRGGESTERGRKEDEVDVQRHIVAGCAEVKPALD